MSIVQSRVDFTKHGIFTDGKNSFLSVNGLSMSLPELLGSKCPWSVIYKMHKVSSEDELISPNPLFPTGSVEDIKFFNEYSEFNVGKICDRCGKSINPYPWSSVFTLCKECAEELEKEVVGKNIFGMPKEKFEFSNEKPWWLTSK